MQVISYFNDELKRRVCFLDGGMEARIQAEMLEEADYRGTREELLALLLSTPQIGKSLCKSEVRCHAMPGCFSFAASFLDLNSELLRILSIDEVAKPSLAQSLQRQDLKYHMVAWAAQHVPQY